MENINIKRLCVVTATRAEYGLLRPIIQKLKLVDEFDIKVIVTGMHLSPEFGLTYKEIEQDKIVIDKKVEILLSADTPAAISKSMGVAMIGFADYFIDTEFDAVILLGDRYEMLAVACVAMNFRIPIIHLYGGETTEGAVDEAIRHAITKLSYLHLTSTEIYRNRVIQMGENPERVFCIGAMGVENVFNAPLWSKQQTENYFNVKNDTYCLVTFHPVTLEDKSSEYQIKQLLSALDEFTSWKFIITKANADKDGRIINQLLELYAKKHENVYLYDSLGMIRYLSVMKYCRMVIGNSSSGLVEAPSFNIPTINIGDRQKGRIRAQSVIDCVPEKDNIVCAMKKGDDNDFRVELANVKNPYGDGNVSEKVVCILKQQLLFSSINLKKHFYNISW